MKIVSIRNNETFQEYKNYIEKFRDDLYLPSFPPNEREPFEIIEARIKKGENWWPRTDMILCIEGNEVASGCISDYYPECQSIEAIYLVTNEKYRGKGLAKVLLSETFNLYPEALDIYLEADNPALVSPGLSAMNPETRIKIYQKLGFKVININYIQPPLFQGLDYERKLLLMSKSKIPLTKERLVLFLDSFYRGLECEGSEEFYEVVESISPAQIYTPESDSFSHPL